MDLRYDTLDQFLQTTQPTDETLAEIQRRMSEIVDSARVRFNSNELIPRVPAQSLPKKGLRRISSDHFFGANSVAIPITSRKQILKVSLAKTVTQRDDVPMLLKPLTEWEENGIKFSAYPEVKTLDKDNLDDWKNTYFVDHLCQACGYILWDLKPENIGVLSNGVPVIIDSGAVCKPEDMFKFDAATGLITHKKVKLFLGDHSVESSVEDAHRNFQDTGERWSIGRNGFRDHYKKLQEFAPEHSDYPQRGELKQELKFIEDYWVGWHGGLGQVLRNMYSELAVPNEPEEILEYQRQHGPNPDRPIPEKFRHLPLRDIMKSPDYHRETPFKSDAIRVLQTPEISLFIRGLEHTALWHQQYLGKIYDKAIGDHNKTMGLKKDAIAGALDDDTLERVQTQKVGKWAEGEKPKSRLVRLVKEYGLDADSLGDLMLANANTTTTEGKPAKDWVERAEETLEAKRRPPQI